MEKTIEKTSKPGPGVTLRAVILGLLLIPANTYFIMANGIAYGRSFPTTVSIMFNVVITLTQVGGIYNGVAAAPSDTLVLQVGYDITGATDFVLPNAGRQAESIRRARHVLARAG